MSATGAIRQLIKPSSRQKERSRLSGLLLFFAAERQNEIRRGARGGGGGEDRFLVVLQDRKILSHILRVIGTRIIGDAEFGAKERCRQFGNLS